MKPTKIKPPQKTSELKIRWLLRKDVKQVLGIETDCFEFPWTEKEIIETLDEPDCIGLVAVDKNERVHGFIIYELRKEMFDILGLAVDVIFQRQYVATRLVNRLKEKLSQQKRSAIQTMVRETNLTAQLFFKSQKFQCIRIEHQPFTEYTDCSEDGYVFRYDFT